MRRLCICTLAVAGLAVGCSPTPNLLPIDDLDRPTDVAFMCFGAFPPSAATPDAGTDAGTTVDAGAAALVVSGRPMRSCHPPDLYDPLPGTAARTFAFMPNSASGGLTMVDADNWKLVDLDPATEGYGTLPLGSNPAQISASDDGCRLLSANRGSCDLTLVDPSVLVAPVMKSQDSQLVDLVSLPPAAQTHRPIRGDGTPLLAAPYEAAFLPQNTFSLNAGDNLCSEAGAQAGPANWPTQTGLTPWRALVTYPSCDLIALIELPSFNIVDSVYVRQTGQSVTLVDAGTSPVCAATDCAGQTLTPGQLADASPTTPEAGAPAPDGGGLADAGGPPPVDAASDAAGPLPADAGMSGGGGVDAGVDGGAMPGLQYPDVAYFGPGPLSPGPIAIRPDGNRAFVGLANASFVVAFDLASPGTIRAPSTGAAIYLHEGAKGATRIRLSVDPYRYKTTGANPLYSGVFVGTEPGSSTDETLTGMPPQDREYLYAIARDGTLRVVQVFSSPESECETNADPLNLPAGVDPSTACIPVDPTHRRPFSVGPGIRFPTVPIDIAAADIVTPPANVTNPTSNEDTSEQTVEGAYAWVITSSGIVYLVNIDPVLRRFSAVVPTDPTMLDNYTSMLTATVPEQWPFMNTLRDRNEISYSVALDPSSGPPRIDVPSAIPSTGPYVEPFWAQGSDNNAVALGSASTTAHPYIETEAFFPREPLLPAAEPRNFQDPIDRRAVTAQTWNITWEGALTGTRFEGQVLGENAGELPGDPAPHGDRDALFKDGGQNFCGEGVLPGDLLTLAGCTVDAQCGVGESCVINAALSIAAAGLPVTGLCVAADRTEEEADKCLAFINSVRRYEIVSAFPTQLVVRPHLDEMVLSSLVPCMPATTDSTGKTITPDSCPDTADDPTTATFTCQTSYPGAAPGAPGRCLMSCTTPDDCRLGMTCVNFDDSKPSCAGGTCFCAEGPPLDPNLLLQCFDQLVAYQVNVGGGFLVEGTQSGILTTAPLQASGACPPNPTFPLDTRFTFRIPMDAPHCADAAGNWIDDVAYDSRVDPDFVTTVGVTTGDDPMSRWTGYAQTLLSIAKSTPTPDPCLFFGGPVASDPTTDPTSTMLPTLPTMPTPGAPPALTHVRALFKNGQLNFVLANLDRAPIGQFQTAFDVHGGFSAQVVQDPSTVEVSMPARIVLGPIDSETQLQGVTTAPHEVPYLFVVDQRRLGLEQGGGPTRGQLLRIHPLGFTSTVGAATGLQPIFQDYNASGGLFPIQ